MGKINVLSKETFNKIAAGEVVERPASVVKEIVENSIDANATEIYIEISEGGENLIKIVDNGEGILKEDMRNAFLPHATSKIKTAEDLFSINTMGFRGEALSSIASVSKVLTKSKTADMDGQEVFVEGGEIRYEKFAPMDQGTLMEIRELFFNVPARKKFLKSNSRETSIITDIVSKIALAHPDISFNFVTDGRSVLKTYGSANQKDVIRQVYNKKIYENLFYFENHYDSFSIYGFIGNEEISRGTRGQQSIFVNKRVVQNRTITAAMERAFKSFATVNKFPFFVLNIDIFPELIDVNIHPQKSEIKFEDDRYIFKCVFDTVHEALRQGLRDTFAVKDEEPGEQFEQLHMPHKSAVYIDIPVDLSKSPESSVRENGSSIGFGNRSIGINDVKDETTDSYSIENARDKKDGFDFGSLTVQEDERVKRETWPEEKMDHKVAQRQAKFPMPKIIGQFRATYILAEIYDELYIFDQHAAHEKINFEKYMKQIKEGDVVSQPLLIPEILDLSLEDFNLYQENTEILNDAGFLIEEFGDRSISIREVPLFLGKTQASGYIQEILDNIRNLGKGTKEDVKYLRIATSACKASIKAYENLTMEEMVFLIEELRFIDEPFTCPHGRPTLTKLTEKDMQKMFRRIV
ncbi:MAG: DNA mismatch repair endonuclease MutL [Clostridiaceae bacterium]